MQTNENRRRDRILKIGNWVTSDTDSSLRLYAFSLSLRHTKTNRTNDYMNYAQIKKQNKAKQTDKPIDSHKSTQHTHTHTIHHSRIAFVRSFDYVITTTPDGNGKYNRKHTKSGCVQCKQTIK